MRIQDPHTELKLATTEDEIGQELAEMVTMITDMNARIICALGNAKKGDPRISMARMIAVQLGQIDEALRSALNVTEQLGGTIPNEDINGHIDKMKAWAAQQPTIEG